MIRLKIENRVEKRIKTFKRGKIFFAQDLFDYGNAGTINKALYRLKEKGVLIRIAHGRYLYPKKVSYSCPNRMKCYAVVIKQKYY